MIHIYKNHIQCKTKFHIPSQPEYVIERKALYDKLNYFQNYKLILLTAPAGYGKTTLAASWGKSFSEGQGKKTEPIFNWLNLDENDNTEDVFYSYFFGSFYENLSVPFYMREAAVKAFGGCESFYRQHLMYFIEDVSQLGCEIIMVLDNFHFITDDKILRVLKSFIVNMPSNIHVILSGRTEPAVEFAKQRVYGEVLEINEKELAFSCEETARVCSYMVKADCPSLQIRDICEQTEGWPAGVWLMAESMNDVNGRSHLEAWMAESGNRISERKNQLLFHYLTEEVFGNLEEKYKKILICTAIPEHFTVPLCNFLLETTEGELYLEEIRRKRIFLCNTDNNAEWYRYHNLFRDFLLRQFYLLEEAIQLKIYRKLESWYTAQKQWENAVICAVKGKEYQRAISLIEEISDGYGYRGEAHVLHRWNRLLPLELVENNPRLLLNSAWAAAADGRVEEVQIYIKKLSALQVSSEMANEILALESSNLSPLDSNLEFVISRCRSAVRDLPEEAFLTQFFYLNIGTAYLFMGNLNEGREYFEKCRKYSMENGRIYMAIVAHHALVRYLIRQGSFREAERKSCSLLMQIEENEEVILPIKGLLYAALAELKLLRNSADKALEMALKGLELGKFGENYWVMGENLLILAKIYRTKGCEDELGLTLKELEECIEGRNFFDLEVKAGLFISETQEKVGASQSVFWWITGKEEADVKKMIAIYPEIELLKSDFSELFLTEEQEKELVLSMREQEILKLIKQGNTNAEIADQLFISVNTVKTHLLNIFEKLGVHNRFKAAVIAEQKNLLF